MNWKDIKGYEKRYQISDTGEVKSLLSDKILKKTLRNGYYSVSLCLNGKSNTKNIHRLVAKTFIPNNNNYSFVNHKNGKKLDNNMNNLEWCTPKQNTQHALNNKLAGKNCKKVAQYSMENKLIAKFDSIKEAEQKTGVSNKHISTVCTGKRNSTGGYKWKYTDEDVEILSKVNGKTIKNFPNYLITPDKKVFSKSLGSYMKQKKMSSGYLIIKLSNNNITKDFYVHKLHKEYYGDTKH